MVRQEGDKERGRNEDEDDDEEEDENEDENERGSTIISQFEFHTYAI